LSAASCFFDFSLAFGDLSPMSITVRSCVDNQGRLSRRLRLSASTIGERVGDDDPKKMRAAGPDAGEAPRSRRPHIYRNHSAASRITFSGGIG
jgi:hypothetical protein